MLGLTLIEMLVAITMSSMILLLVTSIYMTTQKNFHMQEALSELDENARFSEELLRSSIQKSGYIGCAHLSHDLPIQNDTSYILTTNNKLTVQVGSLSDELTIRFADTQSASLVSPIWQSSKLTLSLHPKFNAEDIAVITDCQKAEIVRIVHVSYEANRQVITLASPLHYSFQSSAEVSHLSIVSYFIEKTKRKKNDGSPVYSLFKKELNQQKTELVENVEGMRLTFDVFKDGQILPKNSDNFLDSDSVMGVTAKLLLTHYERLNLKKIVYIYIPIENEYAYV